MKIIYVDGYNVINSWPGLRDVKETSYDIARQKLTDILQNYASYRGCKIIIVFDAHMVASSPAKKDKINDNITIIFTKSGETADSYIEKAVNNIGRKYDVAVVTSDSLEQQIIFQRGAVRMSSLEFYFEIKEIEQRIKVKTEKRYSEKKILLEDKIDPDTLKALEKIRRNK